MPHLIVLPWILNMSISFFRWATCNRYYRNKRSYSIWWNHQRQWTTRERKTGYVSCFWMKDLWTHGFMSYKNIGNNSKKPEDMFKWLTVQKFKFLVLLPIGVEKPLESPTSIVFMFQFSQKFAHQICLYFAWIVVSGQKTATVSVWERINGSHDWMGNGLKFPSFLQAEDSDAILPLDWTDWANNDLIGSVKFAWTD